MTMITPSYLGETIEYSSLHACRSTLEDPTVDVAVDFERKPVSGIVRPPEILSIDPRRPLVVASLICSEITLPAANVLL